MSGAPAPALDVLECAIADSQKVERIYTQISQYLYTY